MFDQGTLKWPSIVESKKLEVLSFPRVIFCLSQEEVLHTAKVAFNSFVNFYRFIGLANHSSTSGSIDQFFFLEYPHIILAQFLLISNPPEHVFLITKEKNHIFCFNYITRMKKI